MNEALGENDVDRRVISGRYGRRAIQVLDMTYPDAQVLGLRNEGTLRTGETKCWERDVQQSKRSFLLVH
jgi:hypothetical protein